MQIWHNFLSDSNTNPKGRYHRNQMDWLFYRNSWQDCPGHHIQLKSLYNSPMHCSGNRLCCLDIEKAYRQDKAEPDLCKWYPKEIENRLRCYNDIEDYPEHPEDMGWVQDNQQGLLCKLNHNI
jgi:hypothetical protein